MSVSQLNITFNRRDHKTVEMGGLPDHPDSFSEPVAKTQRQNHDNFNINK